MFINTSFKTAKSLKSLLGHWHANHFPVFHTIKVQFFIHHKHCKQTKYLILTGSFIFPVLKPEMSQVVTYKPHLSW